MGRVFSVDFEDPPYYMCKNCRTHIALPETHDSDHTPQPGRVIDLFITVINVEVDDQQRTFGILGNHMVSDVYCIKCGDKLGLKYMPTVLGETVLNNDLVELRVNKLLLRDRDGIRDGETLILVHRA